jgi:hypothetical protein
MEHTVHCNNITIKKNKNFLSKVHIELINTEIKFAIENIC